MTVTNWNTTTIDGKNFLVIDVAKFRIPLDWDPSSNMFLAVAAPDGGLGNIPALLKGDPGVSDVIDDVINFTALEPTDTTPDSADFVEISPGIKQLNLSLHKGAKGDAGSITLNPADYGTPISKYLLQVKSDLSGFEYIAPKIGDRYFPATILSASSGNPTFTLTSIGIGAQAFDWRPSATGQCLITGTGVDIQADLIVRLNDPAAGVIIARGYGAPGINPPAHVLSSALAAGSGANDDKVSAGNTATLYLRVERQSGAETFTTLNTRTLFSARVHAIP